MSILARFKSEDQTRRNLDPLIRTLDWAKKVYKVGAKLPANVVAPTEETTGYFIPTFYAYGEKTLAIELAQWEASRQQPDGSFVGADGIPYTFDTAQVIRGYLSVLDDVPELLEPLKKASEYVYSQIDAKGEVHTASYSGWTLGNGSVFSEYAHLYVLAPLRDAGRRLNQPKYIQASERGVQYYRQKPDLVDFKSELGKLSHIFGYMMEALAELGEWDLAKRGLRAAELIQKKDGAIPAYPGVDWICSTGMAQLCVAWYKLGITDAADKAMRYLESIQNPSGGFNGGYGKNAQYFPDMEIGWASKYFLDCYLLKYGRNPLEG